MSTRLRIETAACNPCYNIASDTIRMPPVAEFRSAEAFYSTLAHECVHATGAKHRLDRDMGRERAKYAVEELVAEIGAGRGCPTALGMKVLDRDGSPQAFPHGPLERGRRALRDLVRRR